MGISRRIAAFGVGALAVISVMGAQGGCGASSSGKSAGAAGNSTSTAPAKGKPVVKAKAPAVPKVVLSMKGNGNHTSQQFTVADEWSMAYSYSCAAFGQQGNFIVTIKGHDTEVSLANGGVNQLGMRGADTEHYHHGGTYYVEVNSECAWHIVVRSGA